MKILIADAFAPSLPERLEQLGEVSSDLATLAQAQVLLIRSKTKVTREMLERAPNLKLVIRGGVGLDNVDREACKARSIEVMNTAAASSVAVAELAMAFMLAIPARLIEAHLAMKSGQFPKNELKRTEVFQKTLGLIGAGATATEVARRALGFGMKVIASDPFLSVHPLAELRPLDQVLAQADYLSIHTPLTGQTRGMFNQDAFARMKDGVVIINTARGWVVAEADLAAALASGKVRAYGTDVWASDPPGADCPLLAAPNVFMTPHIGGSSKENLLRIGDMVVDILSGFKC
jgi:D-3-phosphoglycerate dehydrogenase